MGCGVGHWPHIDYIRDYVTTGSDAAAAVMNSL